tara:strand:- start:1759 stop:2370 length:612 start_codon:yes stop_codon:yes gene_type:complete
MLGVVGRGRGTLEGGRALVGDVDFSFSAFGVLVVVACFCVRRFFNTEARLVRVAGSTGEPGSSIRRRIVDGATRPGVVSSGSEVVVTGSSCGVASASTEVVVSSRVSVASVDGGAGLIVLTKRGGPSDGLAGFFGGSVFFFALEYFFFLGLDSLTANISPAGRAIFRLFASRSTNWRATTSSTVLEALFNSIPWFRLSSDSTS